MRRLNKLIRKTTAALVAAIMTISAVPETAIISYAATLENTEVLQDVANETVSSSEGDEFSLVFKDKLNDGYILNVYAKEGVLPEGTEIIAEAISNEDTHSLEIMDNINLTSGEGKYVSELKVFEITFKCDNEIIEPEEGSVRVSLELPEEAYETADAKNSEVKVFTAEKSADVLKPVELIDETDEADSDDLDGTNENKSDEDQNENVIKFDEVRSSEYVVAVVSEFDGELWANGELPVSGADTPDNVDDLPEGVFMNERGAGLPISYRTEYLPNLRNQSPYGSCWAHSAMALSEINMMKQTHSEQDYSEVHLAYFTYYPETAPTGGTEGDTVNFISTQNFLDTGGNVSCAAPALFQWMGAADESVARYDNAKFAIANGLDKAIAFEDAAHMKGYYVVNAVKNRDAAKQLIKDYGAISLSFRATSGVSAAASTDYYNATHNCYYTDVAGSTNHAVSIVGWDDSFPKTNFQKTPEGNGAWLIRNSWTTKANDESYSGYFWLSYYDKTISETSYCFIYDDVNNLDNNYQYDGAYGVGERSLTKDMMAANVFTANSCYFGEDLKSVAFYSSNSNVDYTVSIYKNPEEGKPSTGTLASTVSGTTSYTGYYMVELPTPVPLSLNDTFSVVVNLKKEGSSTVGIGREIQLTIKDTMQSIPSASSGQSYLFASGEWSDYGRENNSNFKIKAFTSNREASEPVEPMGVSVKDKEGNDLLSKGVELRRGVDFKPIVSLEPYYATDTVLEWESSDTTVATVDRNGTVHTILSGETDIAFTVKYNGVVKSELSGSYHLTVNSKISKITIEPISAGFTSNNVMSARDTYDCKLLITPEDAVVESPVAWSTSDQDVITVDNSGHLTAVSVGTAELFAQLEDLEASITVIVYPSMPKYFNTYVDTGKNIYYEFEWNDINDVDTYNINNLGAMTPEKGKKVIKDSSLAATAENNTSYPIKIVLKKKIGGTTYTLTHSEYIYFTDYCDITYFVGAGINNPGNTPKYMKRYDGYKIYDPIPPKGYLFDGWYSNPSFTGAKVKDDYIFWDNTAALYAKYIPISYTVRFNSNDGTERTQIQSFNYDEEKALTANTFDYARHEFIKWNTENDGSGIDYEDKEIVNNLAEVSDEVIDLYAMWETSEYTVSFDSNGGSIVSDSKTLKYEEAYGELPDCSRTGYTFDGWYTASEGGDKITETTIFTADTNQILYAHWIAKSYTVSFDKNGGDSVSSSTKSVKTAEKYGTLPTASKAGYDFDGWYTASVGGEKITSETVFNVADNQTLYAHFSIQVYTISFDSKGAGAIDAIKVSYGQNYPELPVPSKTGYTFDGWYTQAIGGTQVLEGNALTQNANHTLYAHWTAKSYTVSFDKNGGDSVSSDTKSVRTAEKYGTLPTASKAGYDFDGWYTASEGGEKITSETVFNVADNQTLYAHWKAKTITVTFDANGGTCSEVSRSVDYDSEIGELPEPVRARYTFVGWYTGKTSGVAVADNDIVSFPVNTTLYARWTPNRYSIIFDPKGGSCDIEGKDILADEAYGELPDCSRTGYTFDGWYTASEGGEKIVATTIFTESAGQTLYAHWIAKSYTVSFDKNGGDSVSSSTKSVRTAEKYGTLPTASKAGYDFTGWYTASVGGEKITSETVFNVADNQTLYAHFSIQVYTISFDSKGAGAIDAIMVSYGQNYPELPVPSKTGYTFDGWYTQATGGAQVLEGDELTQNANHTLYAHWIANSYTVHIEGMCDTSYADITVIYDSVYPNLPIPDKKGYSFLGWYTAEQGGEKIVASSKVKIAGEHTLYAHWAVNSYKVLFDANGGNIQGSSELIVNYGDKLGELPRAERTGYSFLGWYTNAIGGELVTSDYILNSAEDIHLYAVWKANEYIVSFDLNGAEGSISDRTVVYGNTYGPLPKAERDGYYFDGWYTEKDEEEGEQIEETTVMLRTTAHTLYAHWTFKKKGILWTEGTLKSMPYTGEKIVFDELKAYYGDRLLIEGTDYTVTYKNNIKVGNATLSVSGKGNYSGEIVIPFEITPIALTDLLPSGLPDMHTIFNNKVQKLAPLVTAGNTILKLNTDYILIYPEISNNSEALKNPGTYAIEVKGKENYIGSIFVNEIIEDKDLIDISNADAQNLISSIPYDNVKKKEGLDAESFIKTVMPKFELKVKGSDESLKMGIDYSIDLINNTIPGTATVIFRGKGRCCGTLVKNFAIKGTPVSKLVFEGIEKSYEYTGSDVFPVYTVRTTDGDVLKLDEDYKLTYSKDTRNKGKVTMTFTGMGGYIGSLKKNYSITAYNINQNIRNYFSCNVAESTEYTLGGAQVDVKAYFKGRLLTENVDYTLKFINNNAVNDRSVPKKVPSVEIVGKGNFAGKTAKYEFSIVPRSLTETRAVAPDKVFSDKKNGFKSTPVIYDINGKALSAGRDYNKTIEYRDATTGKIFADTDVVPAGTLVKAIINAAGNNYTGSCECTYRILAAGMDLSKAKVTVATQVYTGSPIKPGKEQIQVLIGKTVISPDFYDVIYDAKNSIKNGNGLLTIRGKHEKGYGGEKTIKFSIVSRSMKYTVYFNGNYADSGSMNPQLVSGMKPATLSRNKFKRSGYEFVGWNTKADGTGLNYSDMQSIENGGEGNILVLYANWRKVSQ